MTPGDVLEDIMTNDGGRLPHGDEGVATMAWCRLAEELKGDNAHMPMSPQEIARVEAILDRMRLALANAKARRPAHFRPVEDGGR